MIIAANYRVENVLETYALESSDYSMLSPSTNEHALLESDTLADELYQDVSTGVYPPHKCLKGAPVKRHLKPDQERCFELSSSKADYRFGRKGCSSSQIE